MQLCLTHPTAGYYSKGDVFGTKGDFITSPEISQIFGELVAIWLLTRWMAAGSPARTRLVELGPGRGTLMDDILRTLSTFPKIRHTVQSVKLVETSARLRDIQETRLAPRLESGATRTALGWADSIEGVPESDEFTMLVAHEFFDAMPIHTFERTAEGWREVRVDVDPSYDPKFPALSAGLGSSGLRLTLSREPTTPSSLLPASSPRWAGLPVGSRIEVSPESWKIMRRAGTLLGGSGGSGGGAGLVVDYGGDRTYGSSFRAFKEHKIVDVLAQPGHADLTANVDFAYLRESVDGLATPLRPTPQASFLLALGLQPRLMQLVASAPPVRRADIEQGAKRLVDRLGMGGQYQVMGVVPLNEKAEVYPFEARAADKANTAGTGAPGINGEESVSRAAEPGKSGNAGRP
ncbi:hypothetical protein Q5752_001149 [Cryptotrichosporon argae]